MTTARAINIAILMVLGMQGAMAQPMFTADLSKNKILIGDQVKLTLKATTATGVSIDWPELNDTLAGGLEILDRSPIDTGLADAQGRWSIRQELLITSFDSGYYVLPPIVFGYKNDPQGLIQTAQTNPLLLEVQTMAVDTTQAIKDIKGPIEAPITLRELLPYMLGGILLAGLIIGIVHYVRSRKKKQPLLSIRPKPVRPPHIIALDDLEALKQKKLWQQNKYKAFHSELSDIIRVYLENRFRINAMEMTTGEVLESSQASAMNQPAIEKLRELLGVADMAKFAKVEPLPAENERSFNLAIEYVKETIAKINEEIKDHVESV